MESQKQSIVSEKLEIVKRQNNLPKNCSQVFLTHYVPAVPSYMRTTPALNGLN